MLRRIPGPLIATLGLLALAACAGAGGAELKAWLAENGPLAKLVAVPPPTPKARQFHALNRVLWLARLAWAFAIPGLFLVSGASARLRGAVEARCGGRFVPTLVAFVLAVLTLRWVAGLPLAYLAGYWRLHAFGLSTETLPHWAGARLKGLLVDWVVLGVALTAPYLLMRRWPRRWWVAAGALVIPALYTLLFLHPLVIAPLFHDFGKMRDPALEADILRLADRCGVEADRVFEVKMSVQTKAVNAYVTGFLGSRRVVLWDTLVDRLARDEVLFVMAHELGHDALGHVPVGFLFAGLGCVLGLGVLHFSGTALAARHGPRWGLRGLDDPAAIPLFVLLALGLAQLADPIGLQISRYMETEADRFALELTRDGGAGARAFVRLQRENLGNPWPPAWEVVLRYTHPPLGTRVEMCNRYRPWRRGRRGRYEHLFR